MAVKRRRVMFRESGSADAAANLWTVFDDEARTFTLEHAYPDFLPQIGWMVDDDGRLFDVVGVSETKPLVLTVKEVAAHG